MLFNFIFANISILSCIFFFFSLFLIIDLYCLITAVIGQIFNPIAKLVTPTAIPSKEAKGEIDIHPVTAEATIRKCSI